MVIIPIDLIGLDYIDVLNLIKRGGGTGPMKPGNQNCFKVLIPEGLSLEDKKEEVYLLAFCKKVF